MPGCRFCRIHSGLAAWSDCLLALPDFGIGRLLGGSLFVCGRRRTGLLCAIGLRLPDRYGRGQLGVRQTDRRSAYESEAGSGSGRRCGIRTCVRTYLPDPGLCCSGYACKCQTSAGLARVDFRAGTQFELVRSSVLRAVLDAVSGPGLSLSLARKYACCSRYRAEGKASAKTGGHGMKALWAGLGASALLTGLATAVYATRVEPRRYRLEKLTVTADGACSSARPLKILH